MIEKDPPSQQVIFAYLTGDDLLHQPRSKPSRWVIDFEGRDIIQARVFKGVYSHLEHHVLPERQAKAKAEATKNTDALQNNSRAKINRHHQHALDQWWLHIWGRLERKTAVVGFSRYIVCSRVTKRPVFDFVAVAICPSDALQTFAFADDYSFGILQATPHIAWFDAKCSTLKGDPRYTSESVFDTFPWPQHPTPAQVQSVAEAARALHSYRRETMLRSETLTLGDLYRTLEVPGKNPLRDLHNALDQTVITAYGFDAGRDILEQLLKLNERVALRIEQGEAVQGPGIPSGYPNPADLVSEGCIQPPELF